MKARSESGGPAVCVAGWGTFSSYVCVLDHCHLNSFKKVGLESCHVTSSEMGSN